MKHLLVLPLALLLVLLLPRPVQAYVDPGTTGSAFSIIAVLLSGAGMIGAFLIRPIKRLFRRPKSSPAPTQERPQDDDPASPRA